MQIKLETLKAKLKTLVSKLKAAAKKKNNLALILVIVAPAVILSVTLAFVFKPAAYSSEDPDQPKPDELTDLRHPLTGELLDRPLEIQPQVLAVMIENSADAWPLSGIADAFLVIEAPVEGNIPRFIAFFSAEQEVDKIGPVRSARPYYLHWAKELDSLYAHVGGSPEALDEIREFEIQDLNEFSQGEYFWRDDRRGSPHNVYTSTEELGRALEEVKLDTPSYSSWLFKTDTPLDPITTDQDPEKFLSVLIDWTQGVLYDVKWRYQAETNDYIRLQNNRLVKTGANESVIANNIVVMAADMRVLDSIGRLNIDNLGEGDALMVQDGKIILGTWNKVKSEDRLRFFNEQGQELAFNPGITWIEVVTSLDKVSTVHDL